MKWTRLFKDFFDSEKTGGVLLLACTAASLLIANGAWGEGYVHFWHRKFDFSFAGLQLNYTIEQWINDGLMTLFFLLMGLEIKRELRAGELSRFSAALLPVAAAGGGMIVPAFIHLFFNAGTPAQGGFGIPMATDIAFSLGALALAGSRVPYSLRIFLTALAIIDDVGAIVVIAAFYNTGLQWSYLFIAGTILSLLFLFNKFHVHRLIFYLLPGIGLWYCMLKSGIHPTIAGVLLAFALPHSGSEEKTAAYRLQKALHLPVGYFIVPLFALANTGISLTEGWLSEMGTPNCLGIIAGLVIGKPVGVLLFCFAMKSFSKVTLPAGVNWRQMIGVAMLTGIGFTMSVFIANLAFGDAEIRSYAKAAVLLASITAAIAGLSVIFTMKKTSEAGTPGRT